MRACGNEPKHDPEGKLGGAKRTHTYKRGRNIKGHDIQDSLFIILKGNLCR